MGAGFDPGDAERDAIDPQHRSIELHVEDLAVSRRVRNTLVRVSTDTETLERAVSEDLLHDDVVLERIPVDRVVDAMPPVRREGDVLVLPVVAEELVVSRRLVLTEEIHLRRVRSTRRHDETVTLRRERAIETRTVLDLPPDDPPPGNPTPPIDPRKDAHPMPDQTLPADETIVAAFETNDQAEIVANDLRAAGVPPGAIAIQAATLAPADTGATTPPAREKGFWATIFGGQPDHDTGIYDRSLERGATVLSVRVPLNFAARATAIIERHAPIDIDERGAGHEAGFAITPAHAGRPAAPRPAETAETAETAAAGRTAENSLQLSEEQLAVGKRVVNRGGTRIRRFVVETPIERDVTLRDERVVLERRPVTIDRPATGTGFSERSIEMTGSAEEAVVSKTARVYEEVGLRKEVADRTETVRDTVRREEVEVERLPHDGRGAAAPIDPSAPNT